jgi:hypothetical protein
MAQLRLFNGKKKNGNGKKAAPKLGVGSCVWAYVDPAETRTPTDPSFKTAKGWRRGKIYAYGAPFKRVWVKLDRAIGEQDLEPALRICVAKAKPKTSGAGMDPAEFRQRAGKMGKYQLETCANGKNGNGAKKRNGNGAKKRNGNGNGRKPKSRWDALGTAKPFGWATPAPLPDLGGKRPKPWRVSHADKVVPALKSMAYVPPFADLYAIYISPDTYRGKLQLWLGLRGGPGESTKLKNQRLQSVFDALKGAGWPVRLSKGPGSRQIYLLDDLNRDELKKPSAGYKAPTKAHLAYRTGKAAPTKSKAKAKPKTKAKTKTKAKPRPISDAKASQIADTIIKQLGGWSRVKAMTGAKAPTYFAGPPAGVQFRFPNPRGPNWVRISLLPSDTYRVEFARIRGYKRHQEKTFDDIYFDALIPLFEETTGLYLRL